MHLHDFKVEIIPGFLLIFRISLSLNLKCIEDVCVLTQIGDG